MATNNTNNNWFSNLLPAITNLAKNYIDTFNQGQATQNQVVGDIANNAQQNLNKQGYIVLHSSDALAKRDQGLTPTAQDLANADAAKRQTMGAVMATVGGEGNAAADLKGLSSGELPPIKNVGGKAKPAPVYTNDYSGINTWSPYVRDEASGSIIKNPHYTSGGESPTQYSQKPSITPTETAPNLEPTTPESTTTLSKTKIPEQPALTPQQIKDQAKSGISNYQLPDSYGDKRAPLEQTDKSVIANVVGGKNPNEVLSNLPVAENKVWNQVSDKASKIPSVDIEQNIVPYINHRLQKLVSQGIITDTQYKELSTQASSGIFAKSTDPLAPTKTITGSDLIDLQTGANAKDPHTIPPNANYVPYVNKAIAQGYRDAIGNISPDIRYLYNQYSSMKRIGEMSTSFRNTAGQPPTWLEKIKSQNPLLTGAEIAVGGPAAIGTANAVLPTIKNVVGAGVGLAGSVENSIANTLGYAPKGQAANIENNKQPSNSHTSSITPGVNSTSFSSIKPNADGTYSLPQSAPEGQNQRHYTTQNEYLQGLQNLAQQYPEGDRNPYYTTAKNNLQEQFATDQKQADEVFKGNNIKNFMDNATTYTDDGNQVGQTFANMPNAATFWNGVGKAGSIKAYTDPAFAIELQQISAFNNEFSSAYESVTGKTPTDDQLLSSANSIGQAFTKYNAMMQFISGTYGKYVSPYLALTSSSGTQTNTGNPTTATTNMLPKITSQPAQDFTGMVGGSNPGLPPIQ